MIKFSVLLSVYNKDTPDFLKQALDSVANQSLIPNEIVIVEDGPIGEALRVILDAFCLKHQDIIKRVVLKENVGLGVALDEGLKYCSFDYVARMDTDDICVYDRFYKQIEFFKSNSDITVLGGYLSEFNSVPGDLNRIKEVPLTPKAIRESIVNRNPLNHPTVMFKKEDVMDCGSYDDMPFFEDYYLWFKLNKKGYKMANIDEVILDYRVGNDMIGRRHGWSYMIRELKFIIKTYQSSYITLIDASFMAILRLPIRIMPKFVISGVYKFLLR